jgi:transcriptional regulator with XRE-family HTH domain
MKSLIQIRKTNRLTLSQLEDKTGIDLTTLSRIESGKHTPNESLRKKLEAFFREPINWFDVPFIVTPVMVNNPKNWLTCEKSFRRLLKMIATLPTDEIESFCKTGSYHLDRLCKNNKE